MRLLQTIRRIKNVRWKTSASEGFLNGTSAQYVQEMYQAWTKDPSSVHLSWQVYFKNLKQGLPNPVATPPTLIPQEFGENVGYYEVAPSSIPSSEILDHMKVQLLVRAYQIRGHQLAKIDPLEINIGDAKQAPELSYQHYGFTEQDLDRQFYLGSGILPQFLSKANAKNLSLREIIKALQDTYCGSIGIEYGHIPDRLACDWLRQKVETPVKYKYSKEQKIAILDRLMWSTYFEQFVAKKYPSEKRFGLEGVESLIPGMKALIDYSVNLGANTIVMGMPHRGRLNVLSNVVRKPNESIFSEFSASKEDNVEGSGDVKYHLGMNYQRPTPSGKMVNLSLVANPSHLEAVNPVVEGKVRGTLFYAGDIKEKNTAIPVLLHGDAAFAAQGVVYETLGMTDLPAYSTGGTIHLIVNNQIGFTTDPRFNRSTPYCSDVAKTVAAPIIHVNADDTEAVVFACELAAEWRSKYKNDVVVDIVGYRKHGHNEIDQPQFTQPLMYERIAKIPTALSKYIQKLIDEKTVTQEEVDAMTKRIWDILEEDYTNSKTYKGHPREWVSSNWPGFKAPSELAKETVRSPPTGVEDGLLSHIGVAAASYPDQFKAHPNLGRVLRGRVKSVEEKQGIDWATAESMAFGSLLAEGNHVRLSGQDVERGTFSQRHALLHDQASEGQYVPLNHLVKPGVLDTQAEFTVCNSSLSEYGTLGFELGYSIVNPNQLVLWEAQFGDFANNAQCIIDQFIASGEQKWLQRTGLTMLLPHGYDGQGPEHSSARVERYLQLVDEDPYLMPSLETKGKGSAARQHQDANMQVVYPTVPSNYFHVLRRQVHREFRKPLVVFTSKALLRHPLAKSSFNEMVSQTQFQRLIPEVLHPNPLGTLSSDKEGYDQYSGNNLEPRLPYSLVNDPQYPVQRPNGEVEPVAASSFSLLPPNEIKTLIFCSGQVYYLLHRARQANNLRHIAIVRLEQLSPFPFLEAKQVVDFYKESLEEIVYCQEESFNSGAWSFVEPRLETAVRNSEWFSSKKTGLFSDKTKGQIWQDKLDLERFAGGLENARRQDKKSVRGGRLIRYAGRDISAAPATGIKKQHKFEEQMFVSEALFGGQLIAPKKMEQDVPIFQ
ncbi:thiamine diphosphate-binding protein [Gorgonomyces haynaldii]|nr:thiamine diphosphate-binding protein [Gorgonomyces haynaldii]